VEEKRIAMAFEKTLDLMRLAEMAASRHKGVSLMEVSAEFGVNPRTAQRMIRGLEAAFPSIEFSTDQNRRRWWKLNDTKFLHMQGIRDHELEALETSIRRAQREGAPRVRTHNQYMMVAAGAQAERNRIGHLS